MSVLPRNKRIEWDLFNVLDTISSMTILSIEDLSVSDNILNYMIGNEEWSGTRYLDDDGSYKIGYGIGDYDKQTGYTEEESYLEWIGNVHRLQRVLKSQLPLDGLPQTVFDALTSLYIDTGIWRYVVSGNNTYDIVEGLRNKDWLLVGDIIHNGSINSFRRKDEARIAVLGDYRVIKDRRQQIVEGIYKIRTRYINDSFDSEFEKKQSEFVYYRQLGRFLPGMSETRQRRILASLS